MTLQQIGQVFLADLQRARSLDIPRGMVVLRTGPRRRGVVSTWPCTDISDKHKKTWPIVGENSQTIWARFEELINYPHGTFSQIPISSRYRVATAYSM